MILFLLFVVRHGIDVFLVFPVIPGLMPQIEVVVEEEELLGFKVGNVSGSDPQSLAELVDLNPYFLPQHGRGLLGVWEQGLIFI